MYKSPPYTKILRKKNITNFGYRGRRRMGSVIGKVTPYRGGTYFFKTP